MPDDDPSRPPPSSLPPVLSELVAGALQRLVDGGRAGLRGAADRGRRRLERRQLERDLEQFWVRLGKTTYHLVEAGELEHPALQKAMDRIDRLQEQIRAARDDGRVDPDPDTR